MLVAVAALVLAVGGVLKLTDPEPTQAMLTAAGLPDRPALVYALGIGEAVVGAGVLAGTGLFLTATLAALYAGFAVLLAVVLRRHPEGVDCGCFGRYSAPPSRVHLVIDAAGAVVVAAAAAVGAPSLPELLEGQAAGGLPILIAVLLGALGVLALLTRTPAATAP